MAATAGIGSAAPAKLTLTYECQFPMIGKQAMAVTITADLPGSAIVGEPTPEFAIDAVATVNETATSGLNLVGAKTIEGTGLAESRLDAPEGVLDAKVPTTVAKTPVPASGSFDVAASGSAPSLTFSKPGTATITVGNLLLTLTPRDGEGKETGLGTFDAPCTLKPGQNTVLATFPIDGEPGEVGGEAAGGVEAGGIETGGIETGGDETGGVESGVDAGGMEAGDAEAGDAEAGGVDAGGMETGDAETGAETGAEGSGADYGGYEHGGSDGYGGSDASGSGAGGATPPAMPIGGSDDLALTGVSIGVPIAVAGILIGSGAMLLLLRRRNPGH